jgi:hypothetical protein
VNPNSGPGVSPWWPNEDYVRDIPRLNKFSNVRIVGYVRTTYCQRPISDVFEDIRLYAKWSRDARNAGLRVDGIFFDETPNLYSEEMKTYLDTITQRVKETNEIHGEKLVRIILIVLFGVN